MTSLQTAPETFAGVIASRVALDADLITRARALAACESPADIVAWITARDGRPSTCPPGSEYAAGFGRAQTMLGELARMAEQYMNATFGGAQ